MTDAELQSIELRALRATEVDIFTVDKHHSCVSAEYGYLGDGKWHHKVEWVYGYKIKGKGRAWPIHMGRISVDPADKPKAPNDAVFFAHAREDILRLIAALKETAVVA